ncbi:MAG: hypothetical protein ACRDQ5_07925 [Sciscionella sp.]
MACGTDGSAIGGSHCRQLVIQYPLPAGIGVERDVLGTVSETRIDEYCADVHLPRLQGEDPILRQPVALRSLVEEPHYGDGSDPEDERPRSPWGYPLEGSPRKNQFLLLVTQIVVILKDVAPHQIANVMKKCRTEMPCWFSLVKSWCEVDTKQDLDLVAPRERLRVEGEGWACWHNGNPIDVSHEYWFDFGYGEPLSLKQWQDIIRRSGDGIWPPTEHLLLRDARGAHVRKQFRHAVLDAATAIEIGLKELLNNECKQLPSHFSDVIRYRSERWTMGTLRDMVGRLTTLPDSMTNDLVALRNEVVHKDAKPPTSEESKKILTAASDLLAVISSLDVPA